MDHIIWYISYLINSFRALKTPGPSCKPRSRRFWTVQVTWTRAIDRPRVEALQPERHPMAPSDTWILHFNQTPTVFTHLFNFFISIPCRNNKWFSGVENRFQFLRIFFSTLRCFNCLKIAISNTLPFLSGHVLPALFGSDPIRCRTRFERVPTQTFHVKIYTVSSIYYRA